MKFEAKSTMNKIYKNYFVQAEKRPIPHFNLYSIFMYILKVFKRKIQSVVKFLCTQHEIRKMLPIDYQQNNFMYSSKMWPVIKILLIKSFQETKPLISIIRCIINRTEKFWDYSIDTHYDYGFSHISPANVSFCFKLSENRFMNAVYYPNCNNIPPKLIFHPENYFLENFIICFYLENKCMNA